MWHDVLDLNGFYRSPLGQVAASTLRQALRRHWPNLRGQSLVGYGYALPYLRLFKDEVASLAALMPAAQGALAWPEEGPVITCLSEETAWPFPDLSLDRILVVHAFEHSENTRLLLREIWRVLKGDGRVLIVAPGRRGLWVRSDKTPFGWGRPFSLLQLQRLLKDQLFTPLVADRALYLPPSERRWLLKSAGAWEPFAKRWFYRAGGVHLIEAKKELYAPGGALPAKARRAYVTVAG